MCAYVCCLKSIKLVHRHPQSSMVTKWLESQSEGENVFEKRRQHTFLSVLKITLYWNHCPHSSLARWTLLSPICPGHHRILEECLKLSIGQEWQRVADHNRHPLPYRSVQLFSVKSCHLHLFCPLNISHSSGVSNLPVVMWIPSNLIWALQ